MSAQTELPPSVEAHIRPLSFRDGEPITIEILGAGLLSEQTVTAVVCEMNDVETHWALQTPVEIDALGHGVALLPHGLELRHEASVYVGSLIEGQGAAIQTEHIFPMVHFSIANPTTGIDTMDDVVDAHERIASEQNGKFLSSLGNPDAPGSIEHRILAIVTGLYLTTALRLPAIHIAPVVRRPEGEEDRDIVNDVLAQLHWPTRVGESDWKQQTTSRTPLTMMVFAPIWAASYQEAAEIARDARDRLVALMALNRRAAGRPVCLVIEQRLPDNSVLSKWVDEQPHYQGNLAGGFLSGENQRSLLHQYRAIEIDPLIKVCCDLFSEALSERSIDAQFLRFWSILELLSGARLTEGETVVLRSGEPWPATNANTTGHAAARVYKYIADVLESAHMDEASFLAPAEDLYQAVRVWYARRNATGHYGRFIADDPRQMRQSWYPYASMAADSTTAIGTWIRALQDTVSTCIQSEIGKTAADDW